MSNKIDKANLDWANLPFGYVKTDFNIRYHYKDGAWSNGDLYSDENICMNIAAPCLHYGQQCFEGIKAFETVDGRIVCFRPEANAKRMNHSADRISIPLIPEEMFLEAIDKVISANARFVPPYGSGASLYIRPLAIGTGAKVGLGPAPEYIFMILVTPVGPYYKGGLTPVKALALEDFDRAAPQGLGDCKVGGNYAAGLSGANYGKKKGYPIVLYLDPKEKKYVDEFGTSNFIGIKGNSYVTPSSQSILASVTNDSLAVLAKDMGLNIEKRPITIDELPDFDEIGAVGTAAVVTPISTINYRDTEMRFCDDNQPGPVITKLYNNLTKLQSGEISDKYNWLREIKVN